MIHYLRNRLGNLDKTWCNFDDQYWDDMSGDERDAQRTQYDDTKQEYDRIRQTLTDQLSVLRESG